MVSLPSDEEEEEEYASDIQSERCESYSPSADVSESESSGRVERAAAASSFSSSPPLAPARAALLPGVPHLVFWEPKLEKREADFSATVFGELWRLEPLAPQKKAMWRREMDWLLCVSDSIVELIPSIQEFPGGGTFEVMVSRPRADLHMNLPALKKLDAMLIGMLDGFQDTEFWYVDRGILVADADEDGSGSYPSSSFGRPSLRQEEKWWLPCPRVPPKGLSDDSRKRLQQCRDCVNQILKASMAINSGVLAEMEIPGIYIETLPKSLRIRFPGLPQTVVDMNKIQYNKDVGQSILESYSRVMESLAFNIMARIDDLIFVDDATKKCAAAEAVSIFNRGGLGGLPVQKRISPSPFSIQNTPYASPFATPTFCSSTPVTGSPGRLQTLVSKKSTHCPPQEGKMGRIISGDLEKVWSYTGNLSARRDAGDAPERD
ncbi:hypothetical protein BHM03_00028801 [Ensete ventricosum]|nr:hypothetical protein BHM03_00028801 [Ensete ventricosum]